MTNWQFAICDGLARVHPTSTPRPLASDTILQAFLGEPASFQLAYRPPDNPDRPDNRPLTIRVSGAAADLVTMSCVGLVPAAFVALPGHDDGYEWDTPGLYPDVLRPAPDGSAPVIPGAWLAVWFDVKTADPNRAGEHHLLITATTADGDEVFRQVVTVSITGVTLPPLGIVSSHWMHLDSLADHYQVPVFSEQHWDLIDRFMASAAQLGANSLLTPVWTPPLDTAVGSYRSTVQLVDITTDGDGTYHFDFSKLRRWLALCRRHGITNIEIAHLFTQWGAAFTPAIVISENNATQPTRAFGWEVAATDPRYRHLLAALLPALQQVLSAEWQPENVVFHISDEPTPENMANYLAAKNVVADLLDGWTVADALSDFAFYQTGAVKLPIVATDHVAPFFAARDVQTGDEPPTAQVERIKMWVYYCVAQHRDVANRFIGMPSARNRAIGQQLFANRVAGFLHWGFNFWYTDHARAQVNPFADTTAGGAFQAGDAFIVYPGEDGTPWPAIRHRVFAQAIWDYRALQAVKARHGEAAALKTIGGPIAFDQPNLDPKHYYQLRQRLVAALQAG